ncbi:hypothetical protein [Ktedonospora formicarum]|uniref:Uncharacterized protein n=1 Tax=Ktedonospora formicarum TaxID=2778364 RepID=A0A8J3MUK5_9CHLR|nr:hypothetical protein [Ktedonospora formicarum]GHO49452.1 hypothetical protein KSX_76150 [Ktedonospora formicarum]
MQHFQTRNNAIMNGYNNTLLYALRRYRAYETRNEESHRSWHRDGELIVLDLPMEEDDYASYGSGGPAQAYI